LIRDGIREFVKLIFFIGTDCDLKHQMCKRKDNIKFNVLTMLPWLKLSIPKNKNSEKDFQLLKQNSGK
jgi:hypothetical protein